MTNKELNALIKREIKESGHNIKDISVSVKDAGYSTSIHIVIKNPCVNKKDIRNIINHHANIDRDVRTGEILAGGNTYIFVDYANGIFDEVSQEWASIAKEAMSSIDETTRIFDGLWLINYEHRGQYEIRQQNKEEHCTFKCYDIKELCIFIYKFKKFGTIAV